MKQLLFLLLLAGQTTFAQNAWKIEPGKSIGLTKIGEPTADVINSFGKADFGDAAMGKSWAGWYSKKSDTTKYAAVYSTTGPEGDAAYSVKQVRVNSPSFKTSGGIKVGSSYATIKKAYPKISRIAVYENPKTKQRTEIYDEQKKGISFEITSKRCTAISVHPAGESANTYIGFPGYENLKLVN
jgi:hypothetical protein